jgi:electron transport complex protein RnfD
VTSPSGACGKIIFGISAAFLAVVIRLWANLPEGVSYAILLMNIICPYIDKLPPRKLFGGKKI